MNKIISIEDLLEQPMTNNTFWNSSFKENNNLYSDSTTISVGENTTKYDCDYSTIKNVGFLSEEE